LPVRIVTLDDIWQERRPAVSFCETDVEGAELRVLEGAGTSPATCRPALLLEADEGLQPKTLCLWLSALQHQERRLAGFMRGITCWPTSGLCLP
jgi:hypothetical protein